MKKILPILLIIIGVAGGGAAGMFLKPPPPPPEEGEVAKGDAAGDGQAYAGTQGGDGYDQYSGEEGTQINDPAVTGRSFVKVGKQTIIPIVEGGETRALMLFELAVDVPAERAADVHELEPRLRDAFLRELFKMAYTGAFATNFTDDRVIAELRRNLTRAARRYIGDDVSEVLILDVMRQEQ